MISLLNAELLKLRTVRSTYVILGLGAVMVLFVSYFVQGVKGVVSASDPAAINQVIIAGFNLIGLFTGILALLQVSHEYRYRTILYTLASSPSRTKTLLAKVLLLTLVGAVSGVVITFLAVQAYELALGLRHVPLTLQHTQWLNFFGRGIWYCVGYTLFGAILAGLFRNLAGALAVMLLMPTTVEVIMTFIIKQKANYLPFSAIGQLMEQKGKISPITAAITVAVYIAVGLTAWWFLFTRRDAE